MLAEMLGRRGVPVAVLDVRPGRWEQGNGEVDGVRWYKCDVGSREEVVRVKGLVEKEVGTMIVCVVVMLLLDCACCVFCACLKAGRGDGTSSCEEEDVMCSAIVLAKIPIDSENEEPYKSTC